MSRTTAVATSVAVTFAPGTTAPEGSVTVPLMLPRKVCAIQRHGKQHRKGEAARKIPAAIFCCVAYVLLKVKQVVCSATTSWSQLGQPQFS